MLLTISLLAISFRFWQLGSVPPSPDWDEAALGYNAYSILKTGRDEYGTFLPLSLRSFDDYKPPLYMYLTIPSVAFFGLETWAVRLPSAIMGVVAVVGTYFLIIELLKSKSIALLSAMLLAISPWHVQFSRIAFEANIGVTLNIWAVWAFLKGIRHGKFLGFSAFLFGVSLYAYHSERIFVPLLLFIVIIVYRRELLRMRRAIGIAMIIGMLTVVPLISVFFNPSTITRLRGTSSLADQTGLLARSVRNLADDQKMGNPWGVFYDNRRIVWAKTVLDGYLSHYSFRWLFLTGDNPRHHAPDMGILYLVELPFLMWGLVTVWKWRNNASRVLFSWILIAPVAASPTTELPHAIRALVFLPTFQVFTAVGIMGFIVFLKRFNKNYSLFAYIIGAWCLVLGVFNVAYYFHMYFGHMNNEVSKAWQYGYKEAVAYTQNVGARYKKVIVSTKLEQPHMFFLFYLKYDPARYLAEGGTASGGFEEKRNRFDKFEFRPIIWDKEVHDGETLYIGLPGEIPQANLLTVRYLDGLEAIRIAK